MELQKAGVQVIMEYLVKIILAYLIVSTNTVLPQNTGKFV